MNVGIFDSGLGGEAIAVELKRLLPDLKIIQTNDHQNMPYGTKSEDEIISLTDSAIQPLIKASCNTIVIACNTATTVAIDWLRNKYPELKFIGIEPMIKPAVSMTKTNNIAVCATPGTLQSKRYQELKDTWAKGVNVIEPDCSNWAELIENNKSDKINLDGLTAESYKENIDVIVLGCTHYHWLKQRLTEKLGPGIAVLEPSDAIANRLISITS